MNTTAKLKVTTDFLNVFRIPPGYLIVDEIVSPNNTIITILGPFPSSIPKDSKVMVRITKFKKPRNYIEWQWIYEGKNHGSPIEMVD